MQRRGVVGDLLIVPFESSDYFDLEKMGAELGFRVKILQELDKAHEWLKMRAFDALLVDSRISLTEQQKLADFLWGKNPAAHLISYSFETKSLAESTQGRLYGAQVVSGPTAISTIREILESIDTPRKVTSDSFNILVVEDLDSPRDIICVYLESLGYPNVTGVSSAQEALDLLNKDATKFSCIVTDVRMPRMTGAEMIKKIRGDHRFSQLPIVVLTAYGTVDCLVDCLRNGASGFLVKPPKRPDMVREMARAMRIYASGKDARLASPDEASYVQELLERRGFGA